MNTHHTAGPRPVNRARRVAVVGAALAALALSAGPVSAWPCRDCGPQPGFLTSPAGATTPCGSQGCGRRYWGPRAEEPCGPDPCDTCNRWRDCNGVSRGPDLLAPWQLPPGRGFMTPGEVGYITEDPCNECNRYTCCLLGGPSCLWKMNPCYPDCILTLFPWPWRRHAARSGCRECGQCRDCRPAAAAADESSATVHAEEVSVAGDR